MYIRDIADYLSTLSSPPSSLSSSPFPPPPPPFFHSPSFPLLPSLPSSSSLLVLYDVLPVLLCISPPHAWNMGWHWVGGVQGHSLARVVPQHTEHGLEMGNIPLREGGGGRGRGRRKGGGGEREGKGRGKGGGGGGERRGGVEDKENERIDSGNMYMYIT